MNERRFPWEIIIALIAGIALGLVYAWILSPVQIIDSAPEALRTDFKDQYRAVIAASYAANGDLKRAQARLTLLGDADSYQALSAQAQQMLAAGEAPEVVQQVAGLASALQGLAPTNPPSTATKAVVQNVTAVGTRPASQEAATSEPAVETETPLSFYTATPRPTQTPIPPPARPFEIAKQEPLCDETLLPGLLQVTAQFASRRQIPGVELILLWPGGEEHFFTGFKPELGNGYADFQMAPGVTYLLRAADGGTPVTGLTPPACLAANGETYYGQVVVILQRP